MIKGIISLKGPCWGRGKESLVRAPFHFESATWTQVPVSSTSYFPRCYGELHFCSVLFMEEVVPSIKELLHDFCLRGLISCWQHLHISISFIKCWSSGTNLCSGATPALLSASVKAETVRAASAVKNTHPCSRSSRKISKLSGQEWPRSIFKNGLKERETLLQITVVELFWAIFRLSPESTDTLIWCSLEVTTISSKIWRL